MADDAGPLDAQWSDARAEALSVLHAALMWHLPEPRWAQVGGAVAEMTAAVAAGSLDALWKATAHLELYSPLRVKTRLGDTPPLPAPKPVRERVAELTETLARGSDEKTGEQAAPDAQARS